MPAAKVLDTGTWVRAEKMMAALLGGISPSSRPAVAASTTTNGFG